MTDIRNKLAATFRNRAEEIEHLRVVAGFDGLCRECHSLGVDPGHTLALEFEDGKRKVEVKVGRGAYHDPQFGTVRAAPQSVRRQKGVPNPEQRRPAGFRASARRSRHLHHRTRAYHRILSVIPCNFR